MHWLVILLGLLLMAGAAFLRMSVISDATDLQRYAFPFWLFLIGVGLVFLGTWIREKGRSVGATLAQGHGTGHGAASHMATAPLAAHAGAAAQGSGLAAAGNAAYAPLLRATDAVGLSSLAPRQAAPVADVVIPVATLSTADLLNRIHVLESENVRLRAYLEEAKAIVSR